MSSAWLQELPRSDTNSASLTAVIPPKSVTPWWHRDRGTAAHKAPLPPASCESAAHEAPPPPASCESAAQLPDPCAHVHDSQPNFSKHALPSQPAWMFSPQPLVQLLPQLPQPSQLPSQPPHLPPTQKRRWLSLVHHRHTRSDPLSVAHAATALTTAHVATAHAQFPPTAVPRRLTGTSNCMTVAGPHAELVAVPALTGRATPPLCPTSPSGRINHSTTGWGTPPLEEEEGEEESGALGQMGAKVAGLLHGLLFTGRWATRTAQAQVRLWANSPCISVITVPHSTWLARLA